MAELGEPLSSSVLKGRYISNEVHFRFEASLHILGTTQRSKTGSKVRSFIRSFVADSLDSSIDT